MIRFPQIISFPRIIAPFLCKKKREKKKYIYIVAPGYFAREYGTARNKLGRRIKRLGINTSD